MQPALPKDACLSWLQAHAKLMAREHVTQQDAIVAVTILEASMHEEYSILGGQDALRTDWPHDADAEYSELEAHVFDMMQAASQDAEGQDGRADMHAHGKAWNEDEHSMDELDK